MWKIFFIKKGFTYIIIGLLICSGLVLIPTQTEAIINNIEYDFIIITPADFSNELQPLQLHKDQHGIITKIVTLDNIYNGNYFPSYGRDKPEQIKYFIKNALETWDIQYVMLVGGKDDVPVRYVDICNWGEHSHCISDLYYADIYDDNGSFCSWDSNNDNIFAGQSMDGMVDIVDLIPDVAIGRLLCRNQSDVEHVVEKIITYEVNTYGKEWFENIILCGGDCADIGIREIFIPSMINRKGFLSFEGEYIGDTVSQIMNGFHEKKIYATGLFKPGIKFLTVKNINNAINDGAGFILFVGHGKCNIAMKTNFPLCKRIWLPMPNAYYSSDINDLQNEEKLPIAVFGGCNCGDFDTVDCPIAWEFVQKKDSGAIASFAATTGSLIIFSSLCIQTYTPYLILKTFTCYSEGFRITGDIWRKVIELYRNDADAWCLGDDFSILDWHHNLANILVLEEWILLGDPSLKIGGYS